MPSSNSNSSNNAAKGGQKASGKKSINTVQTLLSAKKDLETSKPQSKVQKRTHSEISSESDTSMDKTIDKSGLLDLHKDLDEIKLNLQGITKKSDLDILTKDLVRTHDLEIVVTNIVNKLLQRFESSIDKKINARFVQVEKEMQETIDALKLENETLRRRSDEFKETIVQQKKTINQTSKLTQEAIISANYNEQYSRKNNIKVMNFPRRENQDLRSDFIKTVKNDLKVELEVRDVVAIHRIPSREPGLNPVLVRLFSSDVKRKIMREKKELKNNIRFSDDVTKRNMELINRLRDMNCFESVWYYNCGVYGITEDGLQLKFGLYDDVHTRLQQER